MNKEELSKILQYPVKVSLITIGGRPAMGKRTFALNLVELFCKEGKKCLYITDYNKQIITEMLLRLITNPNKQESLEVHTEKFTQAVKELSSWNLFIKSTEFCRIKDIKQMIQKYKPDYLFINMHINSKNRLSSEKLKEISKQNNLIIFKLANTRSEPNNATTCYPKITDLRDKNLGKYSDLVLLLYREAYYNCDIPKEKRNIIEIIQAKPEKDAVKLKFNRETGKIGT